MTSSVSGTALAAELLSSSSEGAVEVVVTLLKHTPTKKSAAGVNKQDVSVGVSHQMQHLVLRLIRE